MRKFITKILAVLTAVSCVFALAVPERAYAYQSYSRNEVSSAWGAGYAFLASLYPEIPYDSDFDNGNYGGFPGAADFVSTVVTAPSSPFMLWVHNYVYYWFSEWRVQTYDDLPDDSEAQQRLIDQQLDAADFIIREWEIWKEKYPGAGAGGGGSGGGDGPSPLPNQGGVFVEFADSLPASTQFTDGTVINWTQDLINSYNDLVSRTGRAVVFANSSTSLHSFAYSIATVPSSGFSGITPADGGVVVIHNPTLAESLGTSDTRYSFTFAYPVSQPRYRPHVAYVSNLGTYESGYFDLTSSSVADQPSGWYRPHNDWSCGTGWNSSVYMVTNFPVYAYGETFNETQVGPAPEPEPSGPSGPTAPDIPSPELPTITNPVSPTIPLTFTDTGNTYTGNETDYSQYLQIIIDNQNTQINQLKDLSNGIVQIWDNYMGWLDSEFDAIYQWFQHFDANWNALFEWLHTIAEDLFSIDQTFTAFRNEVLDVLERILNVLYRIFDKMGMRYSPDSPNPSIEPGSGLDISDPLMTWIKGVIDNILAAISAGIAGLIGTATSSVGNLSNLFPFSLLFDLSLMLGLLNHEPVAPVFDIPYPFSANQNAVLIHVDLSPWTPVMQSFRPMWVLLFALGLAYLSIDMIMALYNFLSPGGDD